MSVCKIEAFLKKKTWILREENKILMKQTSRILMLKLLIFKGFILIFVAVFSL